MARLNEVPPANESLDDLKRKFLRQNRDITRTNTSQSLRIRSLENEVSELLTENLGLRKHIVHLECELGKEREGNSREHDSHIKAQLEAKLSEINALFSGFCQTPRSKRKDEKPSENKSTGPCKSPKQKEKIRPSLEEAIANQEGRLPPIREDKQYPRKTLEQQELLKLISEATISTESPEIEPPPVSQFVDEDPVKIDLPKRHAKEATGENDIENALSMNLEHRRKRRESSGGIIPSNDISVQSSKLSGELKPSLKSGAKRKLSARDEEEEDTSGRRKENIPINSTASRAVGEDKSKPIVTILPERPIKTAREIAAVKGSSRDRRPRASTETTRKVLAPKDINNSPKKTTRPLLKDEVKNEKSEVPKLKPLRDQPIEHSREPARLLLGMKPAVVAAELHPKTPVAFDDISAPSTQPSTARVVNSRDTPPPADLGPGAECARPSRRARGAVSYAEPSLRNKMRRPTKELVDAVATGSKSGQRLSIKAEGMDASSTRIKAEPGDEDAWKCLPLAPTAHLDDSPLRNKSESEQLPNSITTHRKRRESILHQIQLDLSKPGAESAISAVIAEHRKAKAAREKALGKEVVLPTKAMENLEFYEFKESSPNKVPAGKIVEDSKPAARSKRRTSTVNGEVATTDNADFSDFEATRKMPVSISRRRQSTLGVKSSTDHDTEMPRVLRNATSTEDSGFSEARNSRVSARRRSMML
ncbi:hypothetical protein BJ875DRAFT_17078 [Amylocarpus encephaloides]|uniref:Shugoshin n=1 Tax=Amylocarpus encephaloides TaxID=45428 RepID=A0A9P7YJM3_9HELO|nr:hypothetical protein BJ875DRAFT_17078 [Amylocarpus encephaloides]